MAQPRKQYAVTRGARWEFLTRYKADGAPVVLTAEHFIEFRDQPGPQGTVLLRVRTSTPGSGSRIERADQVTTPGEETVILTSAGTNLLTTDVVYADVVPVDGVDTREPLFAFELIMCDKVTNPDDFTGAPFPP